VRVDSVVIGRGPSGSAAARLLAEGGQHVVLFGGGRGTSEGWGETSPPLLRDVLVSQGIWEDFLRYGYPRISGVDSAWGSPTIAHGDYLTQPPGYGWLLPRDQFDAWLLGLAESAGACVLRDARVASLNREGGCWRLQAGDAGDFTAESVFIATGRSAARRFCPGRTALDRLIAVRRTYTLHPDSRSTRPLIEATASGWWYSAVSPAQTLLVVFFSDDDLSRRADRPDGGWDRLLDEATHTRDRIKSRVPLDALSSRSAQSGYVAATSAEHAIPIGDSALSMDPLCSQGICFALESAEIAARSRLALSLNDQGDSVGYSGWLKERLDRYRSDHQFFYAMEDRWPDSAFWARRRGEGRNPRWTT
jgi:flavin-dependent dehydrogenase